MKWPLSAFADEAGATIDEQIAALNNAGLNLIDLRNVDGINITELPLDHAKQVKARLDDAGVSVSMYGSPIGKIDIAEDFGIDQKKLEHLAALSEVFGCKAVRIFSYYNRQGADEAAWKQESVDRLNKLKDLAKSTGLVLYHENERHIFGDLVKNVAVLRDELRDGGDGVFRMIFDFDNYNQSGEDVWAAWEELGDSSDAIHFKESKRQPDGKYQHVPIGTGDGHVERIMQTLADRSWSGPITLEPHLAHSAAVMATGPSGQANQSLKDMTPPECFQIAAEHGLAILQKVGRA